MEMIFQGNISITFVKKSQMEWSIRNAAYIDTGDTL